jgi:AcrR family transcriptional regulator
MPEPALVLVGAEREPAARRADSGGSAAASARRRVRRRSAGPMYEIQRMRILTATAAVCRRMPAARVSVEHVVARSGVSRRTFYEAFKDRDECLRAALEEALRRAGERVIPAYRSQQRWQDAIRAGIEALLAFLDEDRSFGALLIVEGAAGDGLARSRREEAFAALIDAVDRGRGQARWPESVRGSTAEALVGGVLFILRARLLRGRESSLTPLANELTAIVLTPYLGPAAAASELARAATSEAAGGEREIEREAFAGLQMRLTHRTVSVLRAIADLEGDGDGPSNAQIARRAGIADAGQTSKLLARLAQRGLIVKRRRPGRRGDANSWRLTPEGAELERALSRSSRSSGSEPRRMPRRAGGSI